MCKRHDNLFAEIANFDALRRSAYRAIRGKRKKPTAAASGATWRAGGCGCIRARP
jgi:hypothetical protein